jgi:hypothetical protein
MEVSKAMRKTGKLNPKRMKATADEESDGSSEVSATSAGCLNSPSVLSSELVTVEIPVWTWQKFSSVEIFAA